MLSARLPLFPILLSLPALLLSSPAVAQSLSLLAKKHGRITERYWEGSVLAFQLETGAWQKGQLMELRPDSFYIRPFTIKYTMSGPDTTIYGIDGYALTDIYALPKPGYEIEYFNGFWNVSHAGGHVHWAWVKNGLLFRILGVGYIGLQSLNGIVHHDFSWSSNAPGFAVAAAVTATGFILGKTYKETNRVGKKLTLAIY